MERNINMDEVSDGKRYGINDMVKAGCDDCKGCSACCHGMGNSIVLDPYDVYRLTTGLHCSFQELLADKAALHVVDGIILPNLQMTGPEEGCVFLNSQGRCSIHSLRPGMCRIFPLGRIYENNGFEYFLQVHECKKPNRTKVKVKKWIDTPDIEKNQAFINQWHYFLKTLEGKIPELSDEEVKEMNLYLLHTFFMAPYEDAPFYPQFDMRMEAAKEHFNL